MRVKYKNKRYMKKYFNHCIEKTKKDAIFSPNQTLLKNTKRHKR